MTSRHARVMRAMLAAGFATFMAVLSHSVAAAGAPGALAVVLSVVFSVLVCLALTGRRLSLWRLSIAVIASQAIYHGLFTLFGTPSAGAVGVAGRSGGLFAPHDHAAMMAQIHALSRGAQAASPELVAAGWMLVAHALAAVTTIAVLRYFERAFWGIVEGTRLQLRALFTPAVQPVEVVGSPARTVLGWNDAFRQKREHLISSMCHRGPPLAAAG